MYPVPESYRQAMAAAVRSERLRGALALADGGTLTFGPADLMSGSVTLDDQCVTGEELQFGCVYLGQAAFQLRTSLSALPPVRRAADADLRPAAGGRQLV